MGKNQKRNITFFDILNIITNIIYLFGIAVFYLYRFQSNTMFERHKVSHELQYRFVLLFVAVILVKMLILQLYSKKELVGAAFLIAISMMSFLHTGKLFWFLYIPFMIVAAKGVPFKHIVAVFILAVGGFLIITVVASQKGIIEDLQYVRWTAWELPNIYRHSFGTTYPTTFSEFVFFLVLAWGYFRREKITIIELGGMLGLAYVLKKYSDCTTDMAVIVLAVGLFVIYKFSLGRKLLSFKFFTIPSILAMPGFAAVMLYLAYFYDPANKTMALINEKLHERLMLGNTGFKDYGISLWGKEVEYRTTGGTIEAVENYFNLDCSYMLIFINFGILFFLAVMVYFMLADIQAIQMKDVLFVWILFIIALECVMENRLHQPQYNVFLLYLFAAKTNTFPEESKGKIKKQT